MGSVVAKPIVKLFKQKSPAPTPTAPEVSQATATAMDGYDARKTKARGRSTTILTGPEGVEEQTLTLGKKSLLGR
jgi:hypothetical protein